MIPNDVKIVDAEVRDENDLAEAWIQHDYIYIHIDETGDRFSNTRCPTNDSNDVKLLATNLSIRTGQWGGLSKPLTALTTINAGGCEPNVAQPAQPFWPLRRFEPFPTVER